MKKILFFILGFVLGLAILRQVIKNPEPRKFNNICAEIVMVDGNEDTLGICKNLGDLYSYSIPTVEHQYLRAYLITEPELGKTKKIPLLDGYRIMNVILIYSLNDGKTEMVSRW